MKKKHLQKQILAAMLTGVIVVNTCPIVAMAAETMPPETEMVQEATEETTATEAAEIPETPGAEVQTELSGSEAVEVTTTEAETEMAAADVETGTEEIPQTDAPEDTAEDSVTAFVNRLYNVCLEREPDSAGLKNWHDRISSGSISAVDAVKGFLNSKEYQNRQLSDEMYIANLYQVFLNRTGSSSEIQHWLAIYQQGVSKNYLMHGFSNSTEFTNLCASYGVTRGSITLTEERDKYPNVAKMVVNCYAVLDRTPSGSEINQWVSKTRSGGSGTALVKNILQSREYQNKSKNASDADYIADLYQAFFGRSCNTFEVQSWKNVLSNGVSRNYLMAQFASSAEFKKTCSAGGISSGNITLTEERDKHPGVAKMVAGCYQILGRTPAGTEVENWVKKTITTGSGAELADGFFKSQEYHNKNTSNAQYVNDLYTAIFGRTADSRGFSSWKNALDNGTSRDTVRNAFYESAEFKQLCKKNGIVDKKNRYPKAAAVLNQVGWDLKAAFQWSAGMKYSKYTATAAPGTEYYANYGFTCKTGNCYVMAATFCEMARELGYDAKQISGSVPLRSGGYGPHSWVEIEINGTTYVFDPDFTNETKRNGYQITYGQSGTWRYNRGSVMN